VPAVAVHRWNGGVWVVVTLPDGYPAQVPVQDTDLVGERVRPAVGRTTLSVAGIRRLREMVRGQSNSSIRDEPTIEPGPTSAPVRRRASRRSAVSTARESRHE
jgi:hypothetical protein